jgi:NCK adaptor protein
MSGDPTTVYVIAKYDYRAQESQELNLRKLERLSLLDDSRNWWKVANDQGQIGYVPSNYVRKEAAAKVTNGK